MLQTQHTQERWFTVHVNGPRGLLQEIVRTLKNAHTITYRSDGRKRFQTFELYITPQAFRDFQANIPRNVAIAYEEREPEQ
jgi:hypothetical protein